MEEITFGKTEKVERERKVKKMLVKSFLDPPSSCSAPR